MNAFLKRHALLAYFLLAYGISWAIVWVAGSSRFRGETVTAGQTYLMLAGMLLGPSVAGLLMTALTGGRHGLSELGARWRTWRVGRWYAALAINPLLTLAVLVGMALLVSPVFWPEFFPLGLLAGLLVGMFEEIGWTGFALPRLLERYSALKAALILGLLHGGWHQLANYLGSGLDRGGLYAVEALVYWIGGLVAYRILMTWVYVHTRSLLLGQLMHVVYSGVFIALVPTLQYPQYVTVYVVITVVTWILALLVVARYGSSLTGRRTGAVTTAGGHRS